MVKILSLLFCLVLSGLNGQIIIEQNDYFKFDNKYYRGNTNLGLDSIDLNLSAGANQTWDFSWLNDAFVDTLKIIKADLTPFFSEFPNAEFGITSNQNNYFYEDISPEGVNILGRVNYDAFNSVNTVYRYNTSGVAFQFPLAFGNSYSFDYNYRVQFPAFFPGSDSIRQFNQSNFEIVADAWGQLKLPMGDFDVLRLKQTAYIKDTVYIYDTPAGWGEANIVRDSTVTWLFYAKEIGYRLLSFNQRLNNSSKNVNWLKGFTINSLEPFNQPEITIFPQPASDLLTINSDANYGYAIFDIAGRYLDQGTIQKGNNRISVSDFNPGIYFISFQDKAGKNNYSRKIVVSSN